MKVQALFKYLVLLGIVFSLGNCSDKDEKKPSMATTGGPPRAIPVDVYIINPLSLERNIQSTGAIVPYESVQVRPERSGKISSLNITESGYVKEGAILAQIDDTELLAQKQMLTVNLEYLRNEVDRGAKLLAIEGITEEEVDRIKNQVKSAEAEIKVLDIQIEKSKVKAPFSGILGLRMVSIGAYVTPSDVLVDIQQNYKVRLDFDVAEKHLSEVKAGQSISFSVAGTKDEFEAKVYAFGNVISPKTRTFTVRAIADNPKGILKPGQFTKVNLVTGSTDEAMMVPTDAIIPILNGKQVFQLKNGRVVATDVETGLRREGLVEVTEGIQMGDSIIVSALLSVSDGEPVSVGDVINTEKFIDK